MSEYRVTWTIDVAGDSPEDAAMNAYNMQADPASTATVYAVTDSEGNTVTVDVFKLAGGRS